MSELIKLIKSAQRILGDAAKSLQIYSALRFVSLISIGVFLVKFGYSIDQINLFEEYMFIAGAFTFFLNTPINKSLISTTGAISQNKIFLIGAILSVCLGLLCFIYAYFLTNYNPYLLLALVISMPLANSFEYFYLVRRREYSILRYGVLLSILRVLIVGVGTYYAFSISTLLMLLIFLNVLTMVIVQWDLEIFSLQRLDSAVLYKFGPLLGVGLIGGMASYIDGFIVQSYFPNYDFSVFRFGAKEIPLLMILFTSLSSVLSYKIKQKEKDWSEYIKNRLALLIKRLFPLIGLLILLSPYLFTTVFSEQYRESSQFFNVYLLLILFRAFPTHHIILAYDKESWLLKVAILELLTNLIFSIILAYYFGILGIVYATLIAFAVELVLYLWYVRTKLNIHLSSYFPMKTYLISSFFVCLCFLLSRWII